MLYCILIGMVSGFFFLSCLMFVLTDIEAVIDSAAGPLLEIFLQATNNRAGSTCLLMFPLICMVFTTTALMATSSRMSYAFARDRGLPFSKVFAKVHPTLDVPLNALLWTTAWVVIFGLIFLGSSSTFNAITAASVVALGVSYGIPPAINVLRGRRMLPEDRAFKLPGVIGWIMNLVGIAWTILTTVLFVFPPETPVTSNNMNYAVAAFGVIILTAGGTVSVCNTRLNTQNLTCDSGSLMAASIMLDQNLMSMPCCTVAYPVWKLMWRRLCQWTKMRRSVRDFECQVHCDYKTLEVSYTVFSINH